MDVTITMPKWEVDKFIEDAITKAVIDRVELLCAEDVAQQVVQAVKNIITYRGVGDPSDNGAIAQMLDARIAELVANIDDEFLKNTIMDRLIKKM